VSDDPPTLDLPFDHAAILYATAVAVCGRMQEAEPAVGERSFGAPLPRGVLMCGEAQALLPLVLILLVERHPQLLDQAALETALRTAVLPSQTLQ
jgi:hypothetical protein